VSFVCQTCAFQCSDSERCTASPTWQSKPQCLGCFRRGAVHEKLDRILAILERAPWESENPDADRAARVVADVQRRNANPEADHAARAHAWRIQEIARMPGGAMQSREAEERCSQCGRARPDYIADPTCTKGGYCLWAMPSGRSIALDASSRALRERIAGALAERDAARVERDALRRSLDMLTATLHEAEAREEKLRADMDAVLFASDEERRDRDWARVP
jgi:hypothetical protein